MPPRLPEYNVTTSRGGSTKRGLALINHVSLETNRKSNIIMIIITTNKILKLIKKRSHVAHIQIYSTNGSHDLGAIIRVNSFT